MTFGSYVRGRKLTRAAFMLKATSLSISHIVKELKFQSYQSFGRAFRKQFRTSPMQYRKSKSWDVSSSIPLLFLDGIPEHRYVHLPKFFDESGDCVDAEIYHFHPAASALRLAAIGGMQKTDGGIINFFNFKASVKKENHVSIYLKTIYVSEDADISTVLASLADDAQGKKTCNCLQNSVLMAQAMRHKNSHKAFTPNPSLSIKWVWSTAFSSK